MARNKISEEELAAAGAMIGLIILKDNKKPDESWSLTQLALFIRTAEQTALGFRKAEAVEQVVQNLPVVAALVG